MDIRITASIFGVIAFLIIEWIYAYFIDCKVDRLGRELRELRELSRLEKEKDNA